MINTLTPSVIVLQTIVPKRNKKRMGLGETVNIREGRIREKEKKERESKRKKEGKERENGVPLW